MQPSLDESKHAKIQDVYIKLKNNLDTPVVAVLCSNLVTDIELSNSGSLHKYFAPIKIIKLSGMKNDKSVINLQQSETFTFTGFSSVKVWLQELETKNRCDVEIYTHILFKRQ